MASIAEKYTVIGKIRNGQEIDKYVVRGLDGSILSLSRDEVIIQGSRGVISNIRVQTCNGKAIIRGKGVDLTTLPEMNVNNGNVKAKSVKKADKVAITKRIMLNGKLVGYEIRGQNGITKNVLRKNIISLITNGKVENAELTRWTNPKTNRTEIIIRGVGCDIGSLPILITNSSGKIIDPSKESSGLSTRALLVNKGGFVINKKTKKQENFMTGDFLVITLSGDIKVESKESIIRNYKIIKGINESTVDNYVTNIDNYVIEVFGNKDIELNKEVIKKWTIIEHK